ncbi:GDYXXLXY domain-containing protein [Microcoleus vaginatus]|uniref:GDYXXLXY domain-containing protein n=1 Tax=Microcoleus vaginatus TaxID=119532 RepID=UPI0016874EEC|nr:GDYXXLXY domain-containing protein [Microcoleus sp. FACHB-84]MBD2009522.1 GDYXXLXY domain-containing protein [Microcoleus sp. FACHB-45]
MNTENPDSTDQSSEIADTSANPPSFTLPPTAQRLPAWRLWVPLLLQIGLIAAVPAPAVYTFITGKTVVLQTAPVDPYDFLRGYYQVLSYDISDLTNLQKLPGWKDLPAEKTPCPPGVDCPQNTQNVKPPTSFYVILEAPKTATNPGRPQAWKPVRVSLENPTNLPANQIAIKGKYNGWQMEYGLETYYMPEDEREKVNQEISEAQRKQRQSFLVEVKVDKTGHAVPVSLWVRDRNYRF